MSPNFIAVALLLTAGCLSLSAEGRHASTAKWAGAEDPALLQAQGRSLAGEPRERSPSPSPSPASGDLGYKDWESIRTWCIPDMNASYFCTGSTLKTVFTDNQLVPDLLSKKDMQYDVGVKVAYPGRLDVMATFVNRSLAVAAPNVTFSINSARFPLLTLIMLDPDASSRWNASSGPILHWLVTNINNSDLATGTVVQPYRQPSPALGNGIHRYTTLLLRQKTSTPISVTVNQTDPTSRRRYDLYKLMKTYDLDVVGGSFFFSAANS